MRVRASGEGMKYFERARMLAPKIEASADQIEHDRRIPESLLDALVDAGLTRLLLPRSLNGAELDPVTFTQVMEEIRDRKSTRLNSSHIQKSRMPSSA